MDKNSKTVKWIVVASVAAAIAAITTIVVLALRARAKKKAWYEQATFDYDTDDCECFDGMDEAPVEVGTETEE